MPADTTPEQPADDAGGDAQATPATPALPAPTVPAQSREDTDVGWGDYPDRDNDDRLLRDRPPHWDDV